jgi:flagellar M-ring protein FliF
VQVTAVLDFDKVVRETTTYGKRKAPVLAESKQSESYAGGAGAATPGGVVGPDAQLEIGGTGGDGSYGNTATVRENGVDKVVEQSENAPGSVESLHAAVVVDTNSQVTVDVTEINDLVSSAIGLNPDRGDTIETSSVPFDTSVADADAAALEAARVADAAEARNRWIRNGALGGLVLLLVGLAWRRSRKHAQARQDATSYVVEQLRMEQAERTALPTPDEAATALALEPADTRSDEMYDELVALVERQPDEVASLLRGWLVERS